MNEWKKVKLGEICKISAGGDRPSLVSEKETNYCQIPIYSNGIDNQGLYGFTNKAKIKGDAITITGRGANAGTVFYRKTAFYPIIRLLSLEPYNDIINPRYLYYLIKDRTFLSTGSAQPQITVPNISDYVISYNANIVDQQRIATILSRYDSLIENYQKQIKLLEESAQRLYKEWFIDLRFPGHENTKIVDGVPEGWEKANLGTLIEFKRGKTITKKEVVEGNIPVVAGGLEPAYYCNKFNTSKRVITISGSGANAGYTRMYFEKVWASDCSFADSSMTPYLHFVFCFLHDNKTIIDNMQKGAAQPHVYAKDINLMEICIPTEIMLKSFEERASKYFDTISSLQSQIRHLTEARDRLLPKLMGGEIKF